MDEMYSAAVLKAQIYGESHLTNQEQVERVVSANPEGTRSIIVGGIGAHEFERVDLIKREISVC